MMDFIHKYLSKNTKYSSAQQLCHTRSSNIYGIPVLHQAPLEWNKSENQSDEVPALKGFTNRERETANV